MGKFRAKTAMGRHHNTVVAEEYGVQLAGLGAAPLIPHVAVGFYHDEYPEEEMMSICLSLLDRSSAAYCLPNSEASEGTSRELIWCRERGIRLIDTMSDARMFIEQWRQKYGKHEV